MNHLKKVKSNIAFGTLAIVIFVFGQYYFSTTYDNKSQKEKTLIKEKLEKEVFATKKNELENTFKLLYENARTISLLPGVREINGGNRKSENEDVIKSGRFTENANMTVQQIYNNIATNFNVSEIYCVIDGINPKANEIPFFMFDSIIISNKKDAKKDSVVNTDVPEELEAEEYSYFESVIPSIKKTYPLFNYTNLNDLPGYFSNVMRTCDNSEYTSIKNNNIHDADGIIYSIPFYDKKNAFKGVISIIFRTNVLEAKLAGLPFLPINKEEKDFFKMKNIKYETEKSFFLLENKNLGISISDRRNPDLKSKLSMAIPENIISSNLNVNSQSDWKLSFFIDESVYKELLKPLKHDINTQKEIFSASLMFLFILNFILALYRVSTMKKISRFAEMVKTIAEGNGDLSKKVNVNELTGDIKEVGIYFNLFVDKVMTIVSGIDYSTSEMSKAIVNIAENVSEISHFAMDTNEIAEEGMTNVTNTAALIKDVLNNISQVSGIVHELNLNSENIDELAKTITEISERTNMLALNAAIEAARAGEAGRGFSVVADEVRKLAEHTQSAASDITKNIRLIRHDTEKADLAAVTGIESIDNAVTMAYKSSKKLEEILEKTKSLQERLESITAASEEMASTSSEINVTVKQISKH